MENNHTCFLPLFGGALYIGRPKWCSRSSSRSEPVEWKPEILQWLFNGSHGNSLAKLFLLMGANTEKAAQAEDFWSILSD